MEQLMAEHDRLLSIKPDGVEHDVATCVFCTSNNSNPPEGGDMNTYTEDELTAAVREAVAPVQAELDALRSSLAEGEVEERIAAARAELEAQIATLQTELDAATVRATAAEEAHAGVVAWLEAEEAARQAAAELEARQVARREAISEIASLSDEYVEANIDRWTAMDDEAFEVMLEGLKAVATAAREAAPAPLPTGLPAETAMSHSTSNNPGHSAVAELHAAVRGGFDPRTL